MWVYREVFRLLIESGRYHLQPTVLAIPHASTRRKTDSTDFDSSVIPLHGHNADLLKHHVPVREEV